MTWRMLDLLLERVYRGGTAGNTGDDPLARLLPVGNQGGFRAYGSGQRRGQAGRAVHLRGRARLAGCPGCPHWVFTYFGDNRSPGRELHDTQRKGNLLLSRVFEWAHHGAAGRARVPPFLLFDKAGRTAMSGSGACSRRAPAG
jgi:hypothetical protein